MKVYLDCCCYCRQFDDLSQERVLYERNAISEIFELHDQGVLSLIGSEELSIEISHIRNDEKRERILESFHKVDEVFELSDNIVLRAYQIRAQSYIRLGDSLHIAFAEEAGSDVMLTTDDKLIKMAARLNLDVEVMNPTDFIDQYWNGGDF